MRTRYLFLDMDNTLFSPKINGIPASAMKAIRMAQANGHLVFVSTGRSLAECQRYLDLGLDGYVFGAGSKVYADGHTIYDNPFLKEEVKMLESALDKHHIGYISEGQAGVYCNAKGYAGMMRMYSPSATSREDNERIIREEGFYPLNMRDSHEVISKMSIITDSEQEVDTAITLMPDTIHLIRTLHNDALKLYGGDMVHKGISKATGIGHVLKYFHAGFRDAIGIGDSVNDLDMIKACGLGIAMGNADQKTKEAADWVTSDINDNGIWNAFVKAKVL